MVRFILHLLGIYKEELEMTVFQILLDFLRVMADWSECKNTMFILCIQTFRLYYQLV